MRNFSVDFGAFEKSVSKRSHKFEDVKHQFTKVAFDIFRKNDGNAQELWQIQDGEDGQYIVALYSEDELVATASTKSPWLVTSRNNDLNFFYKGDYLCKVACSKLGFSSSDSELATRYLSEKLASNPNLVKSLIADMDSSTVKQVLSKYPELA